MRIFIYEHLTAQGIGRGEDAPGHEMYVEGRAIRDALAEDFGRIPETKVFVFEDAIPVDTCLLDAANAADWSCSSRRKVKTRSSNWRKKSGRPAAGWAHPAKRSGWLPTSWARRPLVRQRRPDAMTSIATRRRASAFPMVWKPLDGGGWSRPSAELGIGCAGQGRAKPRTTPVR